MRAGLTPNDHLLRLAPAQDTTVGTDTDVSRRELAHERACRVQAEARAAAAEERAQAAEERAAMAEWLVGVLRGELIGAPRQRRSWRWAWPWRRHDADLMGKQIED